MAFHPRRDYEVASGFGGLEYSDCGFVTAVNGRSVTPIHRRSPPKHHRHSNVGKVIQGYGVKYDTLFFHDDKWRYIPSGAFDESLKSGKKVRMLLEHNDALEFGDSQTNLILHNDDYGVAFRCHFRDDEISGYAYDLASSAAYTECSIGFVCDPSDAETRLISKTKVQFIHRAELREISLLRAGACPQTNAAIKDADSCRPLFVESKDQQLVRDNKFAELQRSLRRLDAA
jgi:HK97 family phage prohead protease